jgi:hypothetical protein
MNFGSFGNHVWFRWTWLVSPFLCSCWLQTIEGYALAITCYNLGEWGIEKWYFRVKDCSLHTEVHELSYWLNNRRVTRWFYQISCSCRCWSRVCSEHQWYIVTTTLLFMLAKAMTKLWKHLKCATALQSISYGNIACVSSQKCKQNVHIKIPARL